jgi:hypothetical protein
VAFKVKDRLSPGPLDILLQLVQGRQQGSRIAHAPERDTHIQATGGEEVFEILSEASTGLPIVVAERVNDPDLANLRELAGGVQKTFVRDGHEGSVLGVRRSIGESSVTPYPHGLPAWIECNMIQ